MFLHRIFNSAVAALLTELMYMEVLREYMKQLPRTGSGWLAALKDPEVGKALKVMHSEPEKKWTVSELASQVGVSRSAFAKRFSALVGESPIKYLTGWRM